MAEGFAYGGVIPTRTGQCNPPMVGRPRPRRVTPSPLLDPASAPLGTIVVFPAEQDEHHVREIAIRWAQPYDRDEEYPWIILGSDGPQRLSNDVVDGCEVLTGNAVEACATAGVLGGENGDK